MTIIPEQEFSFSYDEDMGLYFGMASLQQSVPFMEAGVSYNVLFDGTTFTCTAFIVEGETAVAVGNMSLAGMGDDTGEPFIIAFGETTEGVACALVTSLPGDSHIVGISELVIPEGVNVYIKNYSGTPVLYENVDKVFLAGENETKVPFSYGEAISGMQIPLSLKNGDQPLRAPDGTLVKSATIIKPDTLIPSNIRNGVDVAGVVGEFVGNAAEKTVLLSMPDGDQVVEADAGSLMSKVTMVKPDTLQPENIRSGIDIGGVVGQFVGDAEEKIVPLAMLDGDQIISASDGKLMSQVRIQKPEGLIPANIRMGVDIGGVVGQFAGGGGNKLYPPEVTVVEGETYDTFTILNPNGNSTFVSSLNIYLNEELLMTKTPPDAGSTISIKTVELYDGVDGPQLVGFEFSGDGYDNSDVVSKAVSMYGINVSPEDLADGYDYPAIKGGGTYRGVINYKGNLSSYVSPDISVTMGGNDCPMSWNPDIGIGANNGIAALTEFQNAELVVPNVHGFLDITVPKLTERKLAKPEIYHLAGTVVVTPPPYASVVKVYLDGVEWETIQGASVVSWDAKQFSMSKPSSGYVLLKTVLNATEDTKVVVRAVIGDFGSSGYAYFGKLDTSLSASSSLDSSSKIHKNCQGLASNEDVISVEYDVPSGEHFYQLKYRALDNSRYSIGSMPWILTHSKTFHLPDSSHHIITAVAQAVAFEEVSFDSSDVAMLEVN